MGSFQKKLFFYSFLLLFLFISKTIAEDQYPEPKCGTDRVMEDLYNKRPESRSEALSFSKFSRNFSLEKRQQRSYIIPIVFHVFGTDFSGKSVDDALIIDALNKTNEDFQGLTADWNDVSADFESVKMALDITFKLAKKDPNGNPTTGINYYPVNSGFGNDYGFDEEIQKYAWDNYKYMNVYIMLDLYADDDHYNSGVSWYPDTWMSDNNLARTVYNGRYLGTNADENFRRIVTHEFGHFFNLKHTFNEGCSMPNDECDDTPPTTSNSGSCNTTDEMCSGYGIPNGENFMDYTECYRMFTEDQVARMVAALENHPARKPLWQPLNLQLTGVADDPITGVVADFTADQTKVPTGKGVTFTDATQTENNTTITSYEWSFPGGNPSSYSGETPPEITYGTEGKYNVTLTVTNSNGDNDTKTKTEYIEVVNEYAKPYFRFGTYSHIGNVTFGSINNTTEENGVNDYLNQHITDVDKGSTETLKVTAKVGNSGSSDNVRIRAWIDWNKNWKFDSDELVMNNEFSASEGDKTFSEQITIPDSAVVDKTGMRVIVCYKQGNEGDNADDVMDSGESEDYGVKINGSVPILSENLGIGKKAITVTYSNKTLIFSSPLSSETTFSLYDIKGKTIFKTQLKSNTQKLPVNLGANVLYWKAVDNKIELKGKLIIKK